MIQFLKTHKKSLTIFCCSLLAVIIAIGCALLVVKFTKNADVEQMTASSGGFSEVSSAPEVIETAVNEVETPPAPKAEEKKLVITSKRNYTTTDSYAVITGTSDPQQPLTMNNTEVLRNADGSFALEVNLNVGDNRFAFTHKGSTTVCKIHYHYVVINTYYPYEKQSLESGSTFSVIAGARPNSTVTATFDGQTITLKRVYAESDNGAEFVNYNGTFTLPNNNGSDVNMGKVKFTATYNNITDIQSSPNITCLANRNVFGSSYIAEVVTHAAETFNGGTADDLSSPLNSYLPKGTVDYCENGMVYDSQSENHYYTLRCGLRVYVDKKNAPETQRVQVTRRYIGTLPDHNELSVAAFENTGRHTVLTLGTLWKAPFQVDLLPQGYANPAKQNYLISATTYDYLDILFFYATVFTGEITIPPDNPIFRAAEVINNNNGSYTLRLHLKNRGMFYGWEAEYNQNGQLCFSFLNPAATVAANNEYGVDLTGVTVLIDAGHGGRDGGAPGLNPAVTPESERNLNLAYKLKAELESIGATVVMTRTGNTELSSDERCRILRQVKPDYCIAIHHDSATRPSANGFGAFHFGPFSSKAANMVYNRTVQAGIYPRNRFEWHYFYLARMTTCPVVLTENGFMSNPADFAGIANEGVNTAKAKAITRGIVDYFIDIRQFSVSTVSVE